MLFNYSDDTKIFQSNMNSNSYKSITYEELYNKMNSSKAFRDAFFSYIFNSSCYYSFYRENFQKDVLNKFLNHENELNKFTAQFLNENFSNCKKHHRLGEALKAFEYCYENYDKPVAVFPKKEEFNKYLNERLQKLMLLAELDN
jgi:hypothetical protein